MNYDIKQGDKKSERYKLIKDLYKFNIQLNQNQHLASGLRSKDPKSKDPKSKDPKSKDKKQSQIIILPENANELVDKLRILKQQRIAGNDSKLINTHIEAIVDQLLKLDVYKH